MFYLITLYNSIQRIDFKTEAYDFDTLKLVAKHLGIDWIAIEKYEDEERTTIFDESI
jgi:hypothetical protein